MPQGSALELGSEQGGTRICRTIVMVWMTCVKDRPSLGGRWVVQARRDETRAFPAK